MLSYSLFHGKKSWLVNARNTVTSSLFGVDNVDSPTSPGMIAYSFSGSGILGSRCPLYSLRTLGSLFSRNSPRGFLSLSSPLESLSSRLKLPSSLRKDFPPSLRGLSAPSRRNVRSSSRLALYPPPLSLRHGLSPSRRGLYSLFRRAVLFSSAWGGYLLSFSSLMSLSSLSRP